MFGADLQNTGYQPAASGPTDDVEVRWALEGDDEFISNPAVVGNRAYAGCRDGYLYAVDVETGEIEWDTELNDRVTPPPTVVDGTVYASSHGYIDKFHALSADSGEIYWEEELENSTQSPVPYEDTIYTFYPGWLISFEQNGSEPSVLFEDYGRTPDAPAISDGILYGGGRHSIIAFDLVEGEIEWEFENENEERMSVRPPSIADGMIYVGSSDSKLYAIDIESGEEEWTFETNGSFSVSPSIAEGTVYILGGGGDVYAIDAQTGQEEWSNDFGEILSGKAAITAEILYFTDDKTVYGLDRDNGEQQWSFTPDEEETIPGSPAVADGVVYISSRDHHLYALEEA
ncbi:PQQ-binding-like beta-propeller repeat protein [Natrialbaceae archaeon A-arb3/5]